MLTGKSIINFRSMKSFLTALLVFSICCFRNVYSQPVLVPSFAAIIVSKLDSSANWYKSVLQLEVKSQITDPAGQYKINILGSENFTLELLELSNPLNRSSLLTGKQPGSLIQGLFKFGFKTEKMDELLNHLKLNNVSVPQIWTDPKTGKRNFIITDPDGNIIQFFE